MPSKISLLVLVLTAVAASNVWAELKTRTIIYKQGGTVLEGYLAYDTVIEGKRPGILVVHEWKGLNDYAKHRAEQLARLGYVAFAADIYGKGIRPKTFDEAGKEAGKYKSDRPLLRARVSAALDVLKSQPNVDPAWVAAIGYCFGGTAVLELARSGADVRGVVSFHGGLGAGPVDGRINTIYGAGNAPMENIKTKVLVLHGEADPFVPPQEVAAFKDEMARAGAQYRFVSYPGAMHGFTNPANTGELQGALYDADADAKSWEAMKGFFKEIFAPPQA